MTPKNPKPFNIWESYLLINDKSVDVQGAIKTCYNAHVFFYCWPVESSSSITYNA